MKCHHWFSLLAACGTLFFVGCGQKKPAEGHAHGGEHDHAEGAAAVSFKEGRGLHLAPETAKALGVATADVVERPVAHRIELHVSIFDGGPPARATAMVSPEIAADLEKHSPREAKIISVNRSLAAATGQVEVALELPEKARAGETLRLVLNGPATNVVAVPASALLRTATGTFVFTVNGDSLLRTTVKIGASDGAFIEITDGLYSGDIVAVAAVEQLWLTELRLTKGGGHSH